MHAFTAAAYVVLGLVIVGIGVWHLQNQPKPPIKATVEHLKKGDDLHFGTLNRSLRVEDVRGKTVTLKVPVSTLFTGEMSVQMVPGEPEEVK